MNPTITGLVIGLLGGLLITSLVVFFTSPSVMMKEDQSKYDFNTTIDELKAGIEEKGWKLPCTHDLRATMAKFDYEVRDVMVLEICNPAHANNILSQDDERVVSSLMPCRIAIYEKSDGKVYLSRMNSGFLAKPMARIIRRTMADASRETEEILDRVILK